MDVYNSGLTADQINLLQQGHRDIAHGSSSSRAASRASSGGRLVLDHSSLHALGRHFDDVMRRIQARMEALTEQVQVVTLHIYDQAGNLIDNVDAEIERYHRLNAQLDELDLDMDRISNIKDIVKHYEKRAEELEWEVERSQSSRHHRHKKDKKDKR